MGAQLLGLAGVIQIGAQCQVCAFALQVLLQVPASAVGTDANNGLEVPAMSTSLRVRCFSRQLLVAAALASDQNPCTCPVLLPAYPSGR